MVEFRQRAGKLSRLQGETQEEQIKMQRWIANIGKKYGLDGLRYRLDIDTGEFHVEYQYNHYELKDSMNALALVEVEWGDNGH